MKKLLLILALALSTNGWGEAKQIICDTPKDLEGMASRHEEWTKKCGPESKELEQNARLWGKDFCPNTIKDMSRQKKECEEANFNVRRTFIIDTDDLSKSEAYAEATLRNCHTSNNNISRIKYKITSSFLSFYFEAYDAMKGSDQVYTVDVDRKTLKAVGGFEWNQSIYTCRIEDVDTSDNQI